MFRDPRGAAFVGSRTLMFQCDDQGRFRIRYDADISMIDPYPPAMPNPDPKLLEEMIGRINAAKKPVLRGGSGTQY